ncbi:MAG TPA: hypothetical protein VJ716_08790 [Gaiellaceae bacterium]|nr:hypothetical protein [Gaiellaceae bacterium]
MKRVVLALFVLSMTAGCGSGMNLAGTKLTLTAINPNVGLAIFHLDCAPTGGDVNDPRAACSALGRDPKLVTAPQPYTCIGGPTSWFDMTISGRLAGRLVHRKFSTCWAKGMATLDKLGLTSSLERHVRPRRRGRVVRGVPRTFPRGALRAGDLLVCNVLHHELTLGIPQGHDAIGKTGAAFGGKLVEVGDSPNETIENQVKVTLSGTRNADGSITASCRRSKT